VVGAARMRMHARVPTRQIRAPHTDPVVLVHGLGVSSRYMLPILVLLAPRYRVFAPDLPGFGHSTKPPHTQPDRSFRVGVVTHFGFYAEGAIQPLVPRIRKYLPSVPFTRVEADTRRAAGEQEVGDLIDRRLDDGPRTEGSLYGVLLLSGPDDPATVRLAHAVQNDTTTRATGRNWAWTIGQRYTRLDRLRSGAKVTSEL